MTTDILPGLCGDHLGFGLKFGRERTPAPVGKAKQRAGVAGAKNPLRDAGSLVRLDRLNRFDHFSGAQAAGADLDALDHTVHQGTHTLNVGVEYAAGLAVGVADVIATHPAFATKITYVGHQELSRKKSCSRHRPRPKQRASIRCVARYANGPGMIPEHFLSGNRAFAWSCRCKGVGARCR